MKGKYQEHQSIRAIRIRSETEKLCQLLLSPLHTVTKQNSLGIPSHHNTQFLYGTLQGLSIRASRLDGNFNRFLLGKGQGSLVGLAGKRLTYAKIP